MTRALRPWLLAALAAGAAGCGGGADGGRGGEGTTAAGGGAATMSAGTAPASSPAAQPEPDASDAWTHLRALAAVGRANRGTRAAGTPRGVATEALVAARLKAAGWTVRFHRVTFRSSTSAVRRSSRCRAASASPRTRTCARWRTPAAATCARR